MSLIDKLDGAHIVKVDKQRRLILAWFGGHGIHVYNENGAELSFWNTGDPANVDARVIEVLESMSRVIKSGEYP